MKQQYTSARTCLRHIPALHKALLHLGVWGKGSVNLDLGGGAYDLATELLAEHGVENLVYDPYNRSDEWNQRVLARLSKGADTVTLSNVLCVIKEASIRTELLRFAARHANKTFIRVYEGDHSGKGAPTRAGWQENRPLASYLGEIQPHFRQVELRTARSTRFIEAVV